MGPTGEGGLLLPAMQGPWVLQWGPSLSHPSSLPVKTMHLVLNNIQQRLLSK